MHKDEVKYTFWSVRANLRPSNKGWRLDYFIIKNDHIDMVIDSTIHNEYTGSDHCPIQLKIKVSQEAINDAINEDI